MEKSAVELLYAMIAKDPSMKVIRNQARTIESLREDAPPKPMNPVLEHAEKTLFQLIKQGADAQEVKMQAEVVQRLKTVLAPSKSRLHLDFALSRPGSLT